MPTVTVARRGNTLTIGVNDQVFVLMVDDHENSLHVHASNGSRLVIWPQNQGGIMIGQVRVEEVTT